MALPFFYREDLEQGATSVILDEPASKHIVQVLRMQNGEALQLTNGRGSMFTAVIADDNRKRCTVTITATETIPARQPGISIGISLLKNATRFEWFLEKATELGVSAIVPLLCARTEKQQFRQERMQGIVTSAMLQSQQAWLPVLHPPQPYNTLVKAAVQPQRLIAHCIENAVKQELSVQPMGRDVLLLIGPEGDFTPAEIELALGHAFTAVGLGSTRLRTETAGVVAAALLCQLNNY